MEKVTTEEELIKEFFKGLDEWLDSPDRKYPGETEEHAGSDWRLDFKDPLGDVE